MRTVRALRRSTVLKNLAQERGLRGLASRAGAASSVTSSRPKSTAAAGLQGSGTSATSWPPELLRAKGRLTDQASAEDAAARASAAATARLGHYEDWMVNLRGEDAWLHGDRAPDWFTGKHPDVCPGASPEGLQSMAMPNLRCVTRQIAQDYFDNSWTIIENLFAGLKGEEPFYRPPVHGLRHPQIFYYGHDACLYVNKLRVAGVLDGPVNAYFESIFEVGVDEMLWDDMHKNDMVWPTVDEVHAYRKEVYKVMCNVIATHPALDDSDGPITVTWDHPMWSLFMGTEHQKIHLETSSVLFREMPIGIVQLPPGWPKAHPSASRPSASHPKEGIDFPQNELVAVAGRSVELGKPRDHPSYGWDNEYGHRAVEVPDFKASKHLITNGEFWQFVSSGGYRTERYWSEDGWAWRRFRNMKWPFFWVPDGPQGSMQFRLRTIFEEKDMQWDWPVDVNYHEARAYCAWKSEQDDLKGTAAYRVITEAEHHLIRDASADMAAARREPMKDRALWAGGDTFAAPGPGAANTNLAYSTQSPVNALPPSSSGHHDAMGNAWEWTEDHFNSLDGFKVHYVYDDFSTPCFDGKHHMIMGGSFISCGDNGASIFCRYHFRPHFLQHSSFRLVTSNTAAPAKHLQPLVVDAQASTPSPKEASDGDVYETQALLDQYLGLHFPASSEGASSASIISHAGAPEHALRFPQRMARLLASFVPSGAGTRALDVGCAVGGSSFELAASGFDEVVGIDFSHAFVQTAQQMQRGEEVRFCVPLEGDLVDELVARHEAHVDAAARQRVSFRQGDACRLLEEAESLGGSFDGVLLANLLCRLPEPLACLDALSVLVKPGGTAVLVTPFSWLEQFTHRSKWLGGFSDPVTGEKLRSKDALLREMEARGFAKVHEEQVPLIIREHARKYQYIVSEATAWRRA
mmetsp:Transcript_148704/g.386633  ORF Transcript_148704/g.386633 Transcript_148704/m.386633 type:complete len:917 (+) Transcript_148704:94-2844(+)